MDHRSEWRGFRLLLCGRFHLAIREFGTHLFWGYVYQKRILGYSVLSPSLVMYLLTWLTELPQVDPKYRIESSVHDNFHFYHYCLERFAWCTPSPPRCSKQTDSIPDRPARSSVAIPTELPGPRKLFQKSHQKKLKRLFVVRETCSTLVKNRKMQSLSRPTWLSLWAVKLLYTVPCFSDSVR